MYESYEQPVSILGKTGQTLIPLLDADTGGPVHLKIGPLSKLHPVRLYGTLPDQERTEHIPAPEGFDRGSASFQVRWIVLAGIPPQMTQVILHRIASKGNGAGKMKKEALHLWKTNTDTITYPATEVKMAQCYPGDVVSVDGTSQWLAMGKGRLWQRQYADHAPRSEEYRAVELYLFATLKWLPKAPVRPRVVVTDLSPLAALSKGAGALPATLGGEAEVKKPRRTIELEPDEMAAELARQDAKKDQEREAKRGAREAKKLARQGRGEEATTTTMPPPPTTDSFSLDFDPEPLPPLEDEDEDEDPRPTREGREGRGGFGGFTRSTRGAKE